MIIPFAYSFQDVQATIVGPGGSTPLGMDAGAAEEGVSLEQSEENDTMQIGAGGDVVHNLHVSRAGKIIVRLLKTSPVNAILDQMYNLQKSSALLHAKNTLVVTHLISGQVYSCTGVAFARLPNDAFAKLANVREWEFNASRIEVSGGSLLSTGA